MSASLNNANLEGTRGVTSAEPTGSQSAAPGIFHAPGREALQALLAFSSLHEQIRNRRARALRDGSRTSAAEVSATDQFALDEVLQLVCERALAITGTDGVAIALSDGGETRCRAAAGSVGPSPGVRLDPRSGFSGACFRTGLIVRCDDSEKDPRVDGEACRRMGLHSMVAVPLMTEQGVIGLLEAFCCEAFGFNDSDVRSLSLLAELVLAALQPAEDSRPDRSVRAADRSALLYDEVSQPVPVEAQQSQIPQAVFPEAVFPEIENERISASTEAQLPNVQSVRDALARVTEDSRKITSSEPARSVTIFSPYTLSQPQEAHKFPRKLVIVVLLVLVGFLVAAGALWWRMRSKTATVVPSPQPVASSTPPETAGSPDASAPPPAAENSEAPAASQESPQPQVTGIRHWSSSDSSTVVIDLEHQVQYEVHRLTDPERIYFDLRGTSLAAGLPKDIEVGDALLVRIRVAQPTAGVTRVVLETKDSPNFSVSMEPNPYRLVIEIRSVTAQPKNTSKVDLFAPMNNLSTAERRVSATPPPGAWLSPPLTSASAQKTPLPAQAAKFRIVLDAGHGGWDMGTVGRKGLLEKNLVLDIVARLGNLVENRLGAEVIYTRRDDSYVSLEKRTEMANLAAADMFLSVHANYSDIPSARGVETYYTNSYSSVHARPPDEDGPEEVNVNWTNVDIREKVQQSRRFADNVQRSLYRTLAAKNPALRNRGVKEASYVVLTGTTMPAILAEVSFVSSPADETKLESAAYRQAIAEALYKGVATYAEGLHRVNLASAPARPAGQ